MKKITLLCVSFLLSVSIYAQVTITHNNSQTIVPLLGLTCQNAGITTDNNFYGVFDLANDFGISGAWEIEQIQFGVDNVTGAPGDSYPVIITFFTTDDGSPSGNLTNLGDAFTTVSSGDALQVVQVDVDPGVIVPAGGVLVVELTVANDGSTGFRLGATDVASNDDSWILAADCGLTDPATYASLGFGDRWHVMNVVGDEVLSVGDNLADVVSIFPVPATDVINVKVPSSMTITEVALFDLLGKNTGVAFSNGQINVSNLSRGVYMLTVKTSEGTLTQKVVKK
jgi:hypothetical protein